jgi:hypothetical protein
VWSGVFAFQYKVRKTGTEVELERFLPYCMPLYDERGTDLDQDMQGGSLAKDNKSKLMVKNVEGEIFRWRAQITYVRSTYLELWPPSCLLQDLDGGRNACGRVRWAGAC